MPLGNPIRKQNESRIISVLATEGQSVFTVEGGYIINHISVFRNGVRLSNSEDFTAGDGSTVTLNNEANIDDRIEFHVFDRFTVNNAIVGAASSQTISGDLVINGKIFGNLDVPSINTGIITAGNGIDVTGGVLNITNSENTLGILSSTDDGANLDLFDNDTQSRIRTVDGELQLRADVGNAVADSSIRFLIDANNEKARIKSDGKVGIGETNPQERLHVFGGNVKFENTIGNSLTIQTHVNNGNDSTLKLEKSRGGTSETIVQDNDDLGMISWGGYDGSAYETGAHIFSEVDGTPASGDMPTRMVLATRTAGEGAPVGRISIGSTGSVSIINDLVISDTIVHSGDSNTKIRFPTVDTISFETGGSQRLNIGSSGNVNIITGDLTLPDAIIHKEDLNTKIRFPATDTISMETSGVERLRIDSNGRLLIGTDSSRQTRLGTSTFHSTVQVESDGEAAVSVSRFNNGTGSSRLVLQKSRGTAASPAVVQDDDTVGQILFSGWDGDTFTNTAQIRSEVDGTPGDDDMPGNLIFGTTADGASGATERMRIGSDGKILVGHTVARSTAGINSPLQIQGTNVNTASLSITRNSADDQASFLVLGKTRGTSNGAVNLVNNDDVVGAIRFAVTDGTDFANYCAQIKAEVGGPTGINSTPGRLMFLTTSEGQSAPTERLRIASDGRSTFYGTNEQDIIHISTGNSAGNTFANVRGDNEAGIRIRGGGSSNGGTIELAGGLRDTDPGIIKFSTGTSGTPTERLRITSDGRIGLNVNNPNDYELDIYKRSGETDAQMRLYNNETGSTNDTILRQQIAGTTADNYIYFGDGDDSNIGMIRYNHENDFMDFTVSTNDIMRMDDRGLLIGTTSSSTNGERLRVHANNLNMVHFEKTGTANKTILNMTHGRATGSTVGNAIIFRNSIGTNVGEIEITNSLARTVNFSDYRMKENIADITNALNTVKNLAPKTFNYIHDETKKVLTGFIAHEVQTVLPQAVTGDKDAVITQALIDSDDAPEGEVGDPIYQKLCVTDFIPTLTAALKEAIAKIETLEARIAALEGS